MVEWLIAKIEWLRVNNDWFFSGAGIAIPIAIISLFSAGKAFSNKQTQKSGNNCTNIQIGKIKK